MASRRSTSPIADEYKTLTHATLDRLRRDILEGELKPGAKIKADDLKKRYDVGNSPVREALFQLISEGFVSSEGQRGFTVSMTSAEELHDITDWRVRLETEALRRSIGRGDVEWEAEAMAAMHRLKHFQIAPDAPASEVAHLWEKHHWRYHFSLYSACNSPWLLRFCEVLIRQGERYRRAFVQYPNILPTVTAEHEELLRLSLLRDADSACLLLDQHIRHAESIWRHAVLDSVPRLPSQFV